jgi:glycosyltransferase involved in cell wall biosynthesis
VGPPYVLHVGDLHVRRNVGTVLKAILDLRLAFGQGRDRRGAEPPRLVCAGVDRGVGAELRSAASSDPEALTLTGAVPEDALLALYRGARLLVYPSLYEGFGLPVLEAMQCGVPVVAANAASLPEVTGDGGLLVDPLDVRGWRDAIEALWQDEAAHARQRESALRRAAGFSWTRTAQETLGVLRQCAGEGRR